MTLTNISSPANNDPAPQKPKKPRHRQWSFVILAVLCGIAGLVLGRLGSLWIAFDVFAQFSVQFTLLIVAMLIAMPFPRFKGLAGVVFFTVLIVAYGLWPNFNRWNTAVSPMPGEKVLRVASFNTYHDNLDFHALEASIAKMDADVVTLIEFSPLKQPLLDSLRATYPHQTSCTSFDNCDEVIISKYPLSNVSSVAEWAGPAYVRATLGPEFKNITILGIHTTRFPHPRAQLKQVQALIKYIENIPDGIVVMGDFNATPFSRITQTLAEGLDLTGLTSLPTWPATFGLPQLSIDHVFVSKGIRKLEEEALGESAGSDHFPIRVTIGISDH